MLELFLKDDLRLDPPDKIPSLPPQEQGMDLGQGIFLLLGVPLLDQVRGANRASSQERLEPPRVLLPSVIDDIDPVERLRLPQGADASVQLVRVHPGLDVSLLGVLLQVDLEEDRGRVGPLQDLQRGPGLKDGGPGSLVVGAYSPQSFFLF